MHSYEFDLLSSKIAVKCSKEIFMPYALFNRIVATAPYRYKHYSIVKKNDPLKKREIAHPAKELKMVQRWVLNEILPKFPVHDSAHAYEKNRSIKTNADRHAKNKYLLKMDFENFFPSINSNDFINIAKNKLEINEFDQYFLQQTLFYKKSGVLGYVLSIGAPTSPMISNIVMYEFDEQVSKFCKERKVTYTRYADDLTFSTSQPNVLKVCEAFVEKLCKSSSRPNLKVNKKKTVHASTNMRRRVTGLILSNDGNVSLGRDRKRIIKAAIHNYKLENKNIGTDKINQLKGWLAFSKNVEPSFFKLICRKYPSEVYELIGFTLEQEND